MSTFRRRQIRRVLKWGGLGLSLVIVPAWAASLQYLWCYQWHNERKAAPNGDYLIYELSFKDGCLWCVYFGDNRNIDGLHVERQICEYPRWSPALTLIPRGLFEFMLPLWIPLLGFRLVFLTPPVTIVKHANCCEAKWRRGCKPFKYTKAPLLVNNQGKTDFPALAQFIYHTARTTWLGKFSSCFRSRRKELPEEVRQSLIAEYERALATAPRSWFARSYEEAMPEAPPKADKDREGTYKELLANADRRRGCSCRRS